MPFDSRDALAIATAALAGSGAAVGALLWWSRRRPPVRRHTAGRDGAKALHLTRRDPAVPLPEEPEDELRHQWSKLQPLRLAR
ncbi:hypothetical protein QQY24_02505 [Streptomyces sp. TG1A-8]|uniref:hypothetical protein n=1 Tax=Streptomyces sp. TG1A-8 TaxID=3051385 RepID=UPI00265BAC50|nr:hypothetical protein [Streptomyces sp. TG1A-8]MDO0924335.1 hypothetical protein [Streptomyces sp. TG1A-8]